jgi:uncharacterized protein (TIGR02757 family)
MYSPMIMPIAKADIVELRARLESIQGKFDVAGQIQNDPISLVMKFADAADREVTALIAAVFAYGNVKQIQATLHRVFSFLGEHPAKTLKNSSGFDWKSRIPRDFKHRFNTADDLGLLLTWLGEALRQSGTLENFFWAQPHSSNVSATDSGLTIGSQLDSFLARLTNLPAAPYKIPKSKGAKFFFPRPSDKSACKRPLLFLRWVAGGGPMDLHLWKNFPRELLVIPLDTHVLRISRHLGLTRRKDNSWRTAVEVTQALKQLDPRDPTRFDFALCHLGISQECPSRFNARICPTCRMNDLCQTYSRSRRARHN